MTSSMQADAAHRSAAFTVMERMLDEGFAIGNADIVDELCAPEFD